jgi:hypothetical protein
MWRTCTAALGVAVVLALPAFGQAPRQAADCRAHITAADKMMGRSTASNRAKQEMATARDMMAKNDEAQCMVHMANVRQEMDYYSELTPNVGGGN